MKKGYLYIATGDKYIKEAIQSAQSIKKHDKKAHATLVTDEQIQVPEFDNIIIQNNNSKENWKDGSLYKVRGLLLSPYEKTFFVDTDTYFYDDCHELFNLLDYNDMLMAHAPGDNSQVIIDNKKVLEGYYPYNTGVIVFNNNEAVRNLLTNWLTIYQEKFELYYGDQPAFMESLLNCKVKIYVLQPIYNFRTPFIVALLPSLKVKIFHGRVSDYEAFGRKINAHENRRRVWAPAGELIIHDNKLNRFKSYINTNAPNSLLKALRQINNLTKNIQ